MHQWMQDSLSNKNLRQLSDVQTKLKEDQDLKQYFKQQSSDASATQVDRKPQQAAYRDYLLKQAKSQSMNKLKSDIKLGDKESPFFYNELKRAMK